MADQGGARPEARVRVVRGEPVGQTFLVSDESIVGRGEGAAIRLDDSRVSRVHARLALRPDVFEVTDLGSANGTIVNGRRAEGTVRLTLGDLLRFGGTTLRVDAVIVEAPPPRLIAPVTVLDVAPDVDLADAMVPAAPAAVAAPAEVEASIAPPSTIGPTDRSRGRVVATMIVLVALIGVGAAAVVFGGGGGGDVLQARTSSGTAEVASGASGSEAKPTPTTIPTALPFAVGACLGTATRVGENPGVVPCGSPEAVVRVTDIRSGTAVDCPSGSNRTSVDRSANGVTTERFAYCTITVSERDGELEIGSCLIGKNSVSGRIDVEERNCADPAANYRVVGEIPAEGSCPAPSTKAITKSTTEATRTSQGKWCLTFIAGRSP